MITGAHLLLYSADAEADRAFLREVLDFPSVDADPDRGGWPIFKLPPAEVAVHPAAEPSAGLYLMCDDITATIATLTARGVPTTEVTDQGWGLVTTVTLPSGAPLGLYQPRHPLAIDLPDPSR